MPEQIDLSGKNILITGGSMGLGYAAAEVCLQAKGRVVISARNQGELDAAVSRLKAEGHQDIIGISADVTKHDEVETALNKVESHFGSLTAVIHSAGIDGPIG